MQFEIMLAVQANGEQEKGRERESQCSKSEKVPSFCLHSAGWPAFCIQNISILSNMRMYCSSSNVFMKTKFDKRTRSRGRGRQRVRKRKRNVHKIEENVAQ